MKPLSKNNLSLKYLKVAPRQVLFSFAHGLPGTVVAYKNPKNPWETAQSQFSLGLKFLA
jgi:hypothetical protein